MNELAIFQAVTFLRDTCHEKSLKSGWWDGVERDNPLLFPTKLLMIISECIEAMEGDRCDLPDDKLPHRKAREVELADALIRILDLAGAYSLNLGDALVEKLKYNQDRADHKSENRAKANGKKY